MTVQPASAIFVQNCIFVILEENVQMAITTPSLFLRDFQFKICIINFCF